MRDEHEEILDLLYEALGKIKKLPFQKYDAPKVVGAMINIETVIDSMETGFIKQTWAESLQELKNEWPE